MTTDLQTSAVDPAVAAAIQIYNRLDPLRNALGVADLTNDELSLFAMVANNAGLDPFTRQIHAIKRKGRVTFQTGIDGYRSTAERTGQYGGSDEAEFEPCDCTEMPKGHPKVARVVVHRLMPNGYVMDQTGIARWHELAPTGDDAFMWRKMPFNQLAKCAEANGLRKAFPKVLGSIYIAEEMEQAGSGDSAVIIAAAAKPTAAERIAARRAAIEHPAATAVIETTIVPASEVGLTKRQFVDALAAAEISPEYAMQVRAAMYPDTTVELSDAERRTLLDSLTEGVVAMDAPSVPLFTEGEWAETAVAPA